MNDEQLKQFAEAKTAVEEQNWGLASNLLELLYQSIPDQEVNRLLVQSLYEDEQFQTALTYALEFESSYLIDEESSNLIISVFSATNQFIRARVFANLLTDNNHQTIIINEIIQAEEQAKLNLTETIATNLKHFYHLGDVIFSEQKQRFENAYQLPLSEYIKGASFLLRDPYTNLLIRSSIVQILQQLKLDQIFKMLWIDEREYEFNAATIIPLDDNNIYCEVNELFKQKMGNEDPVLLDALLREFKLQMVFSYPFIEKIIINTELWTEISIKKIMNQELNEKTPEIEVILDWQNALNHLSEQLFKNMS
ncbi:hypothetical protein FC70_GL001448 [Paucilactobacillus oligofermentans DSM 15707 = LMG 22743]|uniref:TPR repeat-containing protein n=1 Tax=Paucilactobacillus oligofermentans DSM 15707 = LMG 22743 TaxID=1423778 RepID=A0A0R1RM92_9LACO|nr:hypothetical protein [Paucilactobacillus oligofermentans]KRL54651.1 hypothetical protein FC70_GL001448 [Paucilactobacillus oligofermentans DSM 15707 = LMG 22743]CUS26440.1 Uncharacterized protein LACOL_1132 [Paucilactobacillus oligofermentans DSM 15707 = LMG 22743]